MPYIPQEQRQAIDPAVNELVQAIKKVTVKNSTAFNRVLPDGALNYAITKLILETLLPMPSAHNYLVLERGVGLLECAKAELYGKVAAPYEDTKAQQNGEVYH